MEEPGVHGFAESRTRLSNFTSLAPVIASDLYVNVVLLVAGKWFTQFISNCKCILGEAK